jgi:hypothetical protein
VDLFLAISQGIGLALATGVRPFLPPLAAGVLARADVGIDFTGTDFAFLESIPFLAAMVVVTALAALAGRWDRGPDVGSPNDEKQGIRRVIVLSLIALAIVLGALEFGGALQDEGYAGGPGLAAGAVTAAIGVAAAAIFLGGAQARLRQQQPVGAGMTDQRDGASALTLFADAATLVAAVLAILLPPVSYLLLAFALWVLLERRRRAARKYEGLRVLR